VSRTENVCVEIVIYFWRFMKLAENEGFSQLLRQLRVFVVKNVGLQATATAAGWSIVQLRCCDPGPQRPLC
jgi:hypothetical protein